MYKLVIVESPAKCSKIQGFLGQGWKVIASIGHIRHLKQELDSVGLERDFEAKWEWMKEKSKAIAGLKEAASSASQIYLASDDDREGELIAYSVCLLLKLNAMTTPRAVFHEITKTAVLAAIQNPRTLDMNKVNAAQARSILDMMVGYTISPLLWKSIGPALSAGRCQTPALKLVSDREKEIHDFKAQSSWKVQGSWKSKGLHLIWDAHLTDELEDMCSAEAYLELHHDKPTGKIIKDTLTQWTEAPPLPLITSTLQQQASTHLKCSPKETMRIAQRLYEQGHITYMRTDKAVLSEEAVQQAQAHIRQKYGDAYVSSTKSKIKSTKSAAKDVKAQEAHEAIRPTHWDIETLSDVEPKEKRLYELIWSRAIQSVMAPAKGDQKTIFFVADGDDEEDFQWKASWRHPTFPGWRTVSCNNSTEEEEACKEEQWSSALKLEKGQTVEWVRLEADPHETKAPQRYTEATLIKELEQCGIGRPSTFASLIETILEKEYVKVASFEGKSVSIERLFLEKHKQWPPQRKSDLRKIGAEKDRLTTTALGESVLSFVFEHFDTLFNYGFTAQMESRLDKVAEAQEDWKQILRDTWSTYGQTYNALKMKKTQEGAAKEMPERETRKEFGNGLVAILTRKGPLLLKESSDGDKDKTIFYGWPDGLEFSDITEQKAIEFSESKQLGVYKGEIIHIKSGKFGTYAEWNGKRISFKEDDTRETIIKKLEESAESQLRKGAFEIRVGQYGPYIFRWATTGPSRKFVSLPAGINKETVTESELKTIYEAGLSKPSSKGSWRGRGRGRGRGQ